MRFFNFRKIYAWMLILIIMISFTEIGSLSVLAQNEDGAHIKSSTKTVAELQETGNPKERQKENGTESEEIGALPEVLSQGLAADGIIVKYKQGEKLSIATNYRKNTPEKKSDFAKIKPGPGKTITETIYELEMDPVVEYAEPNYILSAQDVDDTLVSQQWAFTTLDTEDAWSDLQSFLNNYSMAVRPVKVAVIDTGIDGTHEDLVGRVAEGKNILTGNNIPENILSDDSTNSHGTMVAGIIAANTNNAAGVAGMSGSFPVSLMPVKVLDQNGYGTMLDIINGIIWAADQGADIINMSFGARLPDYPLALAEAIQYAENKGATLITAAGNEGVSLKGFYPADLEGVLSAAAYEKQPNKYVIAGFSNTDYLWNAYTEKCFLLPGVDILTTTRGNQYGLFTGTSASAAFLSSFAALLAACSDPSEAQDKIHESIKDGAYYGDLTVGIYDAPTAYNVTDEFWYYEPEDTPWAAIRHKGEEVVRDTVTLPVHVNLPGLVDSVSLYLYQGDGDLSSEKTVLETLYNNSEKTVADYHFEWDTTGLVNDVYTLYAKINRTGTAPDEVNPDDWDFIQLSVYNPMQSGLSITVKQVDGSPAAGAVVSVWEVCQSESGEQYACVLDEPAKTDADGKLDITGLCVADGLEYLITVRGTNPGFYYTKSVISPAHVTFDAGDAMAVSVNAFQGDTVLAGADFLAKPVLNGTLLQDEKSESCKNELGNILLGRLDGAAANTFYLSGGDYATTVLDSRQLYFLSQNLSIPEIDASTPPEEKRMTADYTAEILEAVEINLQPGTNDTPDYFGISFDPEDTDDVLSLIGFDLFGTDRSCRVTPGIYTMAASAFYSDASASFPNRHSLITYNLGRQELTEGKSITIGGETPGGDHFIVSKLSINDKEITPLIVPSVFAGEEAYYRVCFTDPQAHSVIRTGSVDIVTSPDGGVILSYTCDNGAAGEIFPATGTVSKNYSFDYNPLYLYRYVNNTWQAVDVMGNSIAFLSYSMKTGEALLKSDAFYLEVEGDYKAEVSVYLNNTNDLIQTGLFDVIGPSAETKNLTIKASLDGINPWGDALNWDLAELALYRLQEGVYTLCPNDAYVPLISDNMVEGVCTLQDIPFSANEPLLLVLCGKNGQTTEGYPDYTLLYRHFTLSELSHDPVTHTWTIHIDGTAFQLVKTSLSSMDETGMPLDNFDGSQGIDMEYGLTFTDASGNPAYFSTGKQTKALWLPNTADYKVSAVRISQDREQKSYFMTGELAIDGTPPGGDTETLILGGPLLKRISVSLNGKDSESAYRIIGVGLKPETLSRPFVFYPTQTLSGGDGGMMGILGYEGLTQTDTFEVRVTPDIYETGFLFARYHVTGGWGYRLSGMADAQDDAVSLTADDHFNMNLGMESSYIAAGEDAIFLPVITDSHDNRLVSVFAADEDLEAWPFGTMNYDTIAPSISVRVPEGQELLNVRQGDITLSGGFRQLYAVEGGRQEGALLLKEYSEDTTFFTGITENLPEGVYTAVMTFGGGPEGTISGADTVFLVRDPALPPAAALSGPEDPVNTMSAEVVGVSAPGAQITLSYTHESNPSDSGILAPVPADARGVFNVLVPLSGEGVYTVTAEVSHNSQSGTHLTPVYIHADRTAPSIPSGFIAVGQNETTVLLSWEASTDTGSGLKEYALYRDGVKIASPASADSSYQDTHLSPGTNYTYLLKAMDRAGNESEPAQTIGNPSSEGDTIPPTAPSGVVAENQQGRVLLRWNAATDNIGVAGYIIYRGEDTETLFEIHRTEGALLQYEDRSVGFNKPYYYRVDAYDASGNQSLPAAGEIVPITTEAPVISEILLEMDKNTYGYAADREIQLGVYANAGASVSVAAITYEQWMGMDVSLGSEAKTMEVILTEAPEGFYSTAFTLPEGTSRINGILIGVGDESYQAEKEALSEAIEFSGSLVVQVTSPETNDLGEFRLELTSASTLEWQGLTTDSGAADYPFGCLSPRNDYTLRLLDDKGNVIIRQEALEIFPGLTQQTEISVNALSSLRVRVIDGSGNPVQNTGMMLVNQAGDILTMGKSFSDGWVRKTLANGNPSAMMDLLYYVPSGQQYTLKFCEFKGQAQKLQYIPFEDRAFELAPGLNTVEIVLESLQRADVNGCVTDYDTGLPVPGIFVDACSLAGGGYTTMTDSQGVFVFGENQPIPANAEVILTVRSADDSYRTVTCRIQPAELEDGHEIQIQKEAYVDLTLDLQVKTFETGAYYPFNDERNRLEYVYPGNSKLGIDFGGLRYSPKSLTSYRVYGQFEPGQEIQVSVDASGYNLNTATAKAVVADSGKTASAKVLLEEKPRINVRFTDENGNPQEGVYRMLALFDMTHPDTPVFVGSKQFQSANTFIHVPESGVYSLIAAWGVADGREQQDYTWWQSLPDSRYALYESLSVEGLVEITTVLAPAMTLFPRLDRNYMYLDGIYNFPNGAMGLNYQVFFKPSDPLGKAEQFIYHVTLPAGLGVQAKPSSGVKTNTLPDGRLDVVSGSLEDYAAGKPAMKSFTLFIEVPAGHDKTDLVAEMWSEYSMNGVTCTEKIRQTEMEYLAHTLKAPDVVFAENLIFLEDADITDAEDESGKITVSGSATGPEVPAMVTVYDGSLEAVQIPIQGGVGVRWEAKINLRRTAVPGKTYLRAKIDYQMPDGTIKTYKTVNTAVNIHAVSENAGEYVKFNMHGFDSGVTYSHTFTPEDYGQSFKMDGINIFQGDILYCSFEVKLNKPHLYENVEIAAVSGNSYEVVPLTYYPDEGIFYGYGVLGENGTMLEQIRLRYNLKPFSAAFPFTMEMPEEIPDNDDFYWRLPPEIRDAEITVGSPGDNSDPMPFEPGPVDFEELTGEDGEYILPEVTIALPSGAEFVIRQKYFPAEGSLLLDSLQKLDLGEGQYAYIGFEEIPGEKFISTIRAPIGFLLPEEVPGGFSAAGYSLDSEVFGVTEMLFKLNDVKDAKDTLWDIWENVDGYKDQMRGIDQLEEDLSEGSCGGMADGMIDSTLKGMRKNAEHFAFGKGLMNAIGYASPGIYNSMAAEMGGIIMGGYEGIFEKQASDILKALSEVRDSECDNENDQDDDDDKDHKKKKKKKDDFDKNIFEPMILVDPSGYVFEAVPGNRLEGVSATIYYLDGTGNWQPYDSEAFDQGSNPNITDAVGRYGWDVFSGQWQVVYEKEGYQTEKSMILPVPPPHLDVNISMVSLDAPAITDVYAGSDGAYIQMVFSHYMLTEAVTDATVTVSLGEVVIPGTITAMETEITSAGNKQYVPTEGSAAIAVEDGASVSRVFRFIPEGDTLTVGEEYTVIISGEVPAYNERALSANTGASGINADGDWQGTVIIPEVAQIAPESIQFEADSVMRIPRGVMMDLSTLLEIYPVEANSFTLEWSSNHSGIAAVNSAGVLTGLTEGLATILVRTDTGLVTGIGIEVYEEPRVIPLSADHTQNSIRFCRDFLEVGYHCYMMATGDRQGEAGLVAGDERYIPVSWHMNDEAGSAGNWSSPPYSTAYTASREGMLTTWVVFRKQVFDGEQWLDVSGSERTSSCNIVVYGEEEDPGSGGEPGSGGDPGTSGGSDPEDLQNEGAGTTTGIETGAVQQTQGAFALNPDGSPVEQSIRLLSEEFEGLSDLQNQTASFAQQMNAIMLQASPWFEIPEQEGIQAMLEIHIPLDPALAAVNGVVANNARLGVYRYEPEDKSWNYVFGKYDPETESMVFKTDKRGIFGLFEVQKTFPDINGSWAQEYIEILAARQIVDGTGKGYFEPQKQLTRAEFLKMLLEALKLETTFDRESSFSDVNPQDWYYEYAVSAQKMGIITGVPGGGFKPNEFILRRDMALMAVRALKAAGIKLEDKGHRKRFCDETEIPEYARQAIQELVYAGILNGDTQSRLLPGNTATRAEAAKIIYLLR